MKSTLKQQLLTLAVLTSLAGAPLVAMAATFTDVQGSWAASAITQLSQEGIIGGYPDGQFRPDNNITRAEFSTVLKKALNLQTSSNASMFTDVPSSNWAAPAIEAVRSTGLVSGYPNQMFMPNKNITRAEAASVIVNASKMPLVDEAEASQILSAYSDGNQVPSWARRHMATALKGRLAAMSPSQGRLLMPNDAATRADVAAMTQNLRVAVNTSGGSNTYSNVATNLPNGMSGSNTNTTLSSGVSIVPAATKFTATLNNGIDSETAKVGDTIMLTLDQGLTSSSGKVVVPSGSVIKGKVSQVTPGGRIGQYGSVALVFSELITPDNQRVSLDAQVATDDGLLRGDTTKGRVLKTIGTAAVGAGTGAAMGTGLGSIIGNNKQSVGKGAVYGTAIGTGLGALASLGRKGKEVDLRSGDKLEIQLTEPLTMAPSANN
jgi:S-layer homology domain